ncbi:sensor histidine kinase [Melittangium boletus]|uniref:histidine kinase n=1 Tax=Melittangium boletus DSM 14713 TaxID=1294270 RepID=A0A250IF58_9BACT|nr:ATP-binding protein [Melittangium boletus]ATB29878.1 two-component sensor histidine kinase [Melittangium boletus DSM 14713]
MSPPSPRPEEGPSPNQEPWPRRWRTFRVFAATLVLLYPMDWLVLGHWSLTTLGVRLVWASHVLLHGVLWRKLGSPWEKRLSSLNSVLTSLYFLTMVWFTGAGTSPYLNMALCLPLMMALVRPMDARPAILSGVTCALGVFALLWEEAQYLHAVNWASMVGTATFIGVYGSVHYRKAQEALHEASVERARREAMERLALAERHRAQTEKMATVGRLAASVMHEVNNPLAFVRSNLDFLRTEVMQQPLREESRAELAEVFEETRQGVERIRQIVSDLKGFSRMDMEEPCECALADVVTDAARLAAVRLKNVARLHVEIPPGLPEVFATRRRLAQAILNLLVNAGDALEDAQVRGGEVRVTGVAEPGRVALLVEDNGPGFAPEVLPHLFEAFFTTKGPEKGTGLGLSLSREMVERCGGTLRAENRAEGGARLRLELPVPARGPGAKA